MIAPSTTTFEATPPQLERIVLLTLVGMLESLRQGCLAEDDAGYLLIQPTAIEILWRKGLSEGTCELLKHALDLEDIRTIDPDTYGPLLSEIREHAFRRLTELKPLDRQTPRWFCAEADRRDAAVLHSEPESSAVSSEQVGTVEIEYRLKDEPGTRK